ncbi:hypothetical protein AAY473_009204 [Plecturocebus cupreus]
MMSPFVTSRGPDADPQWKRKPRAVRVRPGKRPGNAVHGHPDHHSQRRCRGPPQRGRRVVSAANPTSPSPNGPVHPTEKPGGVSWKVTFQPSPKVSIDLHERNSGQKQTQEVPGFVFTALRVPSNGMNERGAQLPSAGQSSHRQAGPVTAVMGTASAQGGFRALRSDGGSGTVWVAPAVGWVVSGDGLLLCHPVWSALV